MDNQPISSCLIKYVAFDRCQQTRPLTPVTLATPSPGLLDYSSGSTPGLWITPVHPDHGASLNPLDYARRSVRSMEQPWIPSSSCLSVCPRPLFSETFLYLIKFT